MNLRIRKTVKGYFEGVTAAIKRQSPLSIGALIHNPAKPFWAVGFFDPKTDTSYVFDPGDVTGFIPFFVSNAGAEDPKHVGKHGVATIGTYAKENDAVLFTLGEYGGGGAGMIYYAVINRTLYFGVVSEARIRKEFAKTLAAPRGYGDLVKKADNIRGYIESSVATATRESKEEALHPGDLESRPILFANGFEARTDQNGGVFKCAPGQGFGYAQMRWPSNLLVKHQDYEDVFIPDESNLAVKAASDAEGAKEHGHTKLYFVPWYDALDPSAIKGLDATAPFDGLGASGMFMLMSQLAREENFELIAPRS